MLAFAGGTGSPTPRQAQIIEELTDEFGVPQAEVRELIESDIRGFT